MNDITLERSAVAKWMRENASEHYDANLAEVNMTSLAEAAAFEFCCNDAGGPLDDPSHWIWDEARLAAERCKAEAADLAQMGINTAGLQWVSTDA